MARMVIAGNWKMNGLTETLAEAEGVMAGLEAAHDNADCVICPPATLVLAMANRARGSRLKVGGQTCHPAESGAHTGDISAEMLADAGASHVILGHSERRADHGESDESVAARVEAALRAGLVPIICVGETLYERDGGHTLDIIAGQLAGSLPDSLNGQDFILAYEPVWAIGTGRTPTLEQIGEVHLAIRERLSQRFGETGQSAPILYGGSMKPGNAGEILGVSEVNGGLIGGASLKAADFLAIYEAAG
ncbi:MAG: triose-phosphate isomerase [Alphaproteobacteria bacterium]|nr:triose-phosphate isomerase [Alphaproteobacteria bacterium]